MTDDEAKKYADSILARPEHGGLLEVFARHALQAIEDRALLVDRASASVDGVLGAGMKLCLQIDASRRHMRGVE